MKIVIPAADLHIGGGCKVLVDIAGALTKKGHEVEVVIPKTATVKYNIPCKLTIVPKLEADYIPYGDIILPNFYTTFQSAFEAWPEQTVRLSLGFEPLWVPNREAALWTYAQEVPILSISSWLDQQIFDHVGRRSTIVSLGIDPRIFRPQGPRIHPHPSKKTTKVILYIARDRRDYALKGFDDFYACMEIIKNEYAGDYMVYLICPDGAVSLVTLGIPERIFYPKNEFEMAKLFRTADVFVASSWFEAFSLPPLEAMACGTPVVTTNSGGVMDFCSHMESAYVTKPRDPRQLAQGICAVLSDRQLAEKLALGGKASAARLTKAHFERNIVNALEEIYNQRVSLN
ncbi:glycosyltransferase family 4 protein [Paenibacillus anseongense]|uniref:glycosyltransferase family 4 protein n=1 Tax=Paenibacillus anseongense TaxID=2682845 RepID=UPI002DB93405|nr:glycosyltransferase family 4 protein [Paenibacillus anseongense]MEC0267520.1 glycosyltransferase family 4 protein [Paenibacillus anseongense]